MENTQENGREMAFGFEEGVKLLVDRVPGTKGYDVSVKATTAVAALKGISLLVCKLAELVGCSEEEVLCKLATVMLAPDPEEGGEPIGY